MVWRGAYKCAGFSPPFISIFVRSYVRLAGDTTGTRGSMLHAIHLFYDRSVSVLLLYRRPGRLTPTRPAKAPQVLRKLASFTALIGLSQPLLRSAFL